MILPHLLKKKYVRIFLMISIVIFISGISIGLYQYNKKAKDLGKFKPDYVLEYHDLVTAFTLDENAATEKYVNRIVEVSGQIYDSEYSSSDSTLSITLKRIDDTMGVICTFNGVTEISGKSFKNGDNITVRGECSGMLMDVLLNNCILVRN